MKLHTYRKPTAWKCPTPKKHYGTFTLHRQLVKCGNSLVFGDVKGISKTGTKGKFNGWKVIKQQHVWLVL